MRASVSGAPTLAEFLGVLRELGSETTGRPGGLLLLDLRGVEPVYSFTEQFTLGEEVGRSLRHLKRLASVVPVGRVTRVSEKAATHRGVNVRVFDAEAEAIAWLLAADAG
jgi:hypothetical protein